MTGKFKVVVSDLHLSAGRVAEGNALEDFGSDDDFASFLSELAEESMRTSSELELIVAGDAFEMLQVPNVDVFDPAHLYRPEDYHSSSEPDSVRKMALIVRGHKPFFKALGGFIRTRHPRRSVTFIKGNHDLNLHWPGVQRVIRKAVGATGKKASLLTFEERRVCRDGIYVEHGNQYAEFLNRVEDMEEPLDHDKPGQLDLPLGSWFVMDVFNEIERQRFWIDGVKPIPSLLWYMLMYDFAFAARGLAILLRALPGVVEHGLLASRDPRSELVRELEDPARVQQLELRYRTDSAFGAWFNAEVAHLLSPLQEVPGDELLQLIPAGDAAAMGDRVRGTVRSSLRHSARKRAAEEGSKVVVFGHTHDALIESLPHGAIYINSGTWTWCTDLTGADQDTWRDLFEHPEAFAENRLLSYARIDYDGAGEPSGRLLAYETAQPRGIRLPRWLSLPWNWLRNLWNRLFRRG
jgi:UDP-2,3-diacylglucosamine pyrophosphatase LpxH